MANQILLYTLSTCPWCAKTKEFLKEHNIKFDSVDYDLASLDDRKRIYQEIIDSGNNVSFPYVKIGNEVVVGWDPDKYRELLGLKD